MSMETLNYVVSFSAYSERYFIKKFAKKHKDKWASTKETIKFMCERIDTMLQTQRADLIQYTDDSKIVKLDFAIVQSHMSPKSSGNRCIIFVNERLHTAEILLVYSKNEIGPPNETQKWKEKIFDGFPDIAREFGWRK